MKYAVFLGMIGISILLFVYPAASSDGNPADKLSEILNRGKLIIATNPDYPPQSEQIKGVKRPAHTECFSNELVAKEMTGFDIDVAKEVAGRLGVEPCFVLPAWGEIVSGRWGDRWDIAIATVGITEERMESLYYAQPYLSGPEVFFVHKDNTSYQKPADLSGKKIGVCAGCSYEYYLNGTLTMPGQKIEYLVKDPEIIAYDVEVKCFKNMALGDGVKIDAVLTNSCVGNQAIANGVPIRPLSPPVYYGYSFPVIDKKQSRDPLSFIKKINDIINRMYEDGSLLKIVDKYYGLETDVITPAKNYNIQSLGQYDD